MSHFLQHMKHPFPLLLKVEWVLLGLAILGELPWVGIPFLETFTNPSARSFQPLPGSTLLALLCILTLALMGLRLPTGRTITKLIYTGLEFGLIWLAIALEGGRTTFLTLYLVIIIRGCLIFKQPGDIMVTGTVLLSFVMTLLMTGFDNYLFQGWFTNPQQVDLTRFDILPWIWTINSLTTLSLAILFVMLMMRALLAENRSRQALAIAHEQLRQYALRIEDQAMLQERNRIAREIHDSLGHALTAQNIQLQNAFRYFQLDSAQALESLQNAKQLGVTALKEIRHSVSTLRANALHDCSCRAAVAALVKDFHNTMNLTVECSIDLPDPIPVDVSVAVYRVAQEALTNVAKHSQATQVSLRAEIINKWFHLEVQDNGRGFNPEQNTTGFGLQGMRERTSAIGGQCRIMSQPGAGCCVAVKVPLINKSSTKNLALTLE